MPLNAQVLSIAAATNNPTAYHIRHVLQPLLTICRWEVYILGPCQLSSTASPCSRNHYDLKAAVSRYTCILCSTVLGIHSTRQSLTQDWTCRGSLTACHILEQSKMTTPNIRWSSPTQLLTIGALESVQNPEFSGTYGLLLYACVCEVHGIIVGVPAQVDNESHCHSCGGINRGSSGHHS
jgi:hypothetical protein